MKKITFPTNWELFVTDKPKGITRKQKEQHLKDGKIVWYGVKINKKGKVVKLNS